MKKLFALVWHWLNSLLGLGEVVYRVDALDDEPETAKKDYLYIIGHPEHPWKAMMVCPCGCKEIIELNLAPPGRPLWRLSLDAEELPTLHPSVWRTTGCRSHFWLRHGSVKWCRGEQDAGP